MEPVSRDCGVQLLRKRSSLFTPIMSPPLPSKSFPGSIPGQVMRDLCWKSGTGVDFLRLLGFSPVKSYSTNCPILPRHPGWYNNHNCERCTKWTQLSPHHTMKNCNLGSYPLGKVKLSLCLTNQALYHEGVWGVDVSIHIFLTSALVGGEWSASRSDRFIPGERAPGTHCIGGWLGLRAGLNAVEKRKFLTLPGLELRPLGRPARSQSLYRLTRIHSDFQNFVHYNAVTFCVTHDVIFGT
jgi:hypothetical protein